ncbi:protein eyes shut homolog [Zootoca vivipara]|uniref:protein eyes shut homolog n=1 Tax=Zootoca vivipara TaxID=8524 RepID=UPI00293BDC4F|nr:protein eyes shut homolog [Zootoca vivipara]
MDVSGTVSEALKSALPSPARPVSLSVCQENLCHNGGTCHPINLPDGVNSFQCDCPLHFTGRFCEKDTTLFFPSFAMNSYLELPSLTSLSKDRHASGPRWNRMMIHLTVKTTALNGTLLYTGDEHAGGHFLHLYLDDGRPTAQLGCSTSRDILTATVNHSISRDALVPITVRLPVQLSQPPLKSVGKLISGAVLLCVNIMVVSQIAVLEQTFGALDFD